MLQIGTKTKSSTSRSAQIHRTQALHRWGLIRTNWGRHRLRTGSGSMTSRRKWTPSPTRIWGRHHWKLARRRAVPRASVTRARVRWRKTLRWVRKRPRAGRPSDHRTGGLIHRSVIYEATPTLLRAIDSLHSSRITSRHQDDGETIDIPLGLSNAYPI